MFSYLSFSHATIMVRCALRGPSVRTKCIPKGGESSDPSRHLSQVLYCDDFEGKLAATADGIAFLYPKLTEEWVMAAIGEEPEMLFSLPKHQVRANRMDVAELPIDLQNLIVWSTRQKHALQ